MRSTMRALEAARRAGGDRIYGSAVTSFTGMADVYALRVLDDNDRLHFARQLTWDRYVEAVEYWCALNQAGNRGQAA